MAKGLIRFDESVHSHSFLYLCMLTDKTYVCYQRQTYKVRHTPKINLILIYGIYLYIPVCTWSMNGCTRACMIVYVCSCSGPGGSRSVGLCPHAWAMSRVRGVPRTSWSDLQVSLSPSAVRQISSCRRARFFFSKWFGNKMFVLELPMLPKGNDLPWVQNYGPWRHSRCRDSR